MRKQSEGKLKQLSDDLEKAKAAYREAKAGGADRQELEPLAERLVKTHEGVERFLERHPGLRETEG